MADVEIGACSVLLGSGSPRGNGLAAVVCLGLAAAGCSAGSAAGGTSRPSGAANVAYAASLSYLNEKIFGPAFAKATGYKYQGTAGPSDGLSSEIQAKTIFPNVFISVGGKPIAALEPKFANWFIQYAATSIVLAYNPASKYASQFQAIASGKKPLSELFALCQRIR